MAARAFRWLSGVTPAQQPASTTISASGKNALASSALEMTQISVQRPMKVDLPHLPLLCQQLTQLPAPEGRLVQYHGVLGIRCQFANDLPALRSPDAVGHRQSSALLRVQIVRPVGVPGEDQLLSPGRAFRHPVHDPGDDRRSLRRTQRAADEIVLHIYDHQNVHLPTSNMIVSLFLIVVSDIHSQKGETSVDFPAFVR